MAYGVTGFSGETVVFHYRLFTVSVNFLPQKIISKKSVSFSERNGTVGTLFAYEK